MSGWSFAQIDTMMSYLEEKDTIRDAPHMQCDLIFCILRMPMRSLSAAVFVQ